jgi:recombination protein RecT
MAKQQNRTKPAVKILKDELTRITPSLNAMVPFWINAERITKLILLAQSRNPRLKECTTNSIILFCMDCARSGLEPGPGGAWPVPFKNGSTGQYECQFIPDWRGMIFVAKKTGQITDAKGVTVHENDQFEYEEGDEPFIRHIPNIKNPGKPIAFYCMLKFPDGSKSPTVMTLAEIEAIRNRSKAKNDGPWKTDFEQMAIKTVVKRALKRFAGSPELDYAMAMDNKNTGLRAPIREPFEIGHEEIKDDQPSAPAPGPQKKEDLNQDSGTDPNAGTNQDQEYLDPDIPPADLFPDSK